MLKCEKGLQITFLVTKEVVTLLANCLILLDRLGQLFRHLGHQNLSIISKNIDSQEKKDKKGEGGGGVGGGGAEYLIQIKEDSQELMKSILHWGDFWH